MGKSWSGTISAEPLPGLGPTVSDLTYMRAKTLDAFDRVVTIEEWTCIIAGEWYRLEGDQWVPRFTPPQARR